MNALETLLNRRWILKSEEKELYYQIRDAAEEIRPFLTEKLGCHLIENSVLVKLEKIPAHPEAFMGIEEFHSVEEYVFFCILLMFLEDRDAEEQFILSQLTEYIAANSPEAPVDWTLYSHRRKLVRVLRYSVAQGILRISDGSDEGFMNEYDGEVLYENTGTSRYYMRSFPADIMNFQKVEDFNENGWYAMDEDRGLIRRHRVYNRLLLSPGMFRESGSPEDFEYLKYYHRRLREDLEKHFDCQVQIYKGSAFFFPGEDCRIGHTFPENNTASDAILLACGVIRERVEEGSWSIRPDETIHVDFLEWETLLLEVRRRYGAGFSKSWREMSAKEFSESVTQQMKRWTFLRSDEELRQIIILPSAGRITARYPEEFSEENPDNVKDPEKEQIPLTSGRNRNSSNTGGDAPEITKSASRGKRKPRKNLDSAGNHFPLPENPSVSQNNKGEQTDQISLFDLQEDPR